MTNKYCFHRGTERGRDKNGVPLGYKCFYCGIALQLCNCVYDNEGKEQSGCKQCRGCGWIKDRSPELEAS